MSFFRVKQAILPTVVLAGLVGGPALADDAGSLNPMAAVDRAALSGFVERPLFDPTRRLTPPPPPVVAFTPPPSRPPAEPPPSLQLLGIIHGRRDMAIVHRDGGEKTVILRNGERLGSWIVTVRPPVGVSLRNGDRTVNFAIFAKQGQPGLRAPQPMAMNGFLRRRNPDE